MSSTITTDSLGDRLIAPTGSRIVAKQNGELYMVCGGGSTLKMYSSADLGANWHRVELNSLLGFSGSVSGSSICIGSDDVIHVAFVTTKVYYFNTKNFDLKEIATIKNGSLECYLAIDGNDKLHLIYVPADGYLSYTSSTDNGENWSAEEEIDTSFSPSCGAKGCMSMAIDNNNYPHVVWEYASSFESKATALMYSERTGGSWAGAVTIATAGVGSQFEGGLNVENTPGSADLYVVSTHFNFSYFSQMCYTNQSGSWAAGVTVSTISGGIRWIDIAISGDPYFQFLYGDTNSLMHASYTNADLSGIVTTVTAETLLGPVYYQNFLQGAVGAGIEATAYVYYDASYSSTKFGKLDNWTSPAPTTSQTGGIRIGSRDFALDTMYPSITAFTAAIDSSLQTTLSWDWDGGSSGAHDINTFDSYTIYGSLVSQADANAKGGTEYSGGDLNIRTTESYTITHGVGTIYYAMFTKDIYGNESPTGTYTANTATAPLISSVTAAQTTSSNGHVGIVAVVTDANNEGLKLKVVYGTSTAGTDDPTLYGSSVDKTTPVQSPLPDINNANTYQVGTATNITGTCDGSIVEFRWDSHTDLGAVNSTYYIGIIASDGTLTSNTEWSSGFTIDSRPDKPDPIVEVSKTAASITFNQTATTGETESTEYAIHVAGDWSGWVTAGGGTAASENWQTSTNWTNTTLSGLTKLTDYTFYTRSRYSAEDPLVSDDSDTITITTPSIAPLITTVTISTPSDGSKQYTIEFDLSDEDNTILTLSYEYYDSSDYRPINTASGHFGEVAVSTISSTYTMTWEAGSDANDLDIASCKIRITADDKTNRYTKESGNFKLDTKNPDTGSAELYLDKETINSIQVTWSATCTTEEINFDTYEIYVSSDSQSEASSRTTSATCILWNKDNDANLAYTTATTAVITGLTFNTTYYFAFDAVDTFGNYSTVLENSTATLAIYDITGQIKDQNGYFIPNATLYVYRRSDGALVTTTTSDTNGDFSFIVNDDNNYYIVAYKSLYGAGVLDNIVGVQR